MARITDTPLFKAIAPKIKSKTRKQLAKELAIVKKYGPDVGWHQTRLSYTFIWSESKQGHSFWLKLQKEIDPEGGW